MKVAYFPSFFSGKEHGGQLRTRQIFESIQKEHENLFVFDIDSEIRIKLRDVFFILSTFIELIKRLKLYCSLKTQLKQALTHAYVKNILNTNDFDKLIVEQAPGFSLYTCQCLIDLNLQYELHLHNVEFCVNGQLLHDEGYHFSLIRRSYTNAAKIYVISSFDLAIANVYNNNVTIFPYVSNKSNEIVKHDVVAKEQSPRTKKLGLILGSITNPPTRAGVESLIARINSDANFFNEYTFIVVGFGTNEIVHLASDRVKVLGEVTSESLSELCVDTDSFFIYQPPTTGWLTRINDMERYGKPIYINDSYIQAKSETNYIRLYHLEKTAIS